MAEGRITCKQNGEMIIQSKLDIRETGHSKNLDIREKKGGPLDSLISRFDCIATF
jgi:hypothetical protein